MRDVSSAPCAAVLATGADLTPSRPRFVPLSMLSPLSAVRRGGSKGGEVVLVPFSDAGVAGGRRMRGGVRYQPGRRGAKYRR